jgi:hypothetical protein
MQVNIRFVNFPKPGGKFGNLVLDNGQQIWVPPALLNSFRAGMSCEIGTKEQTWGADGPNPKQVIVATTGPQGGAQQGYGGQRTYNANQDYGRANTYQRPNTGFQPRVYQGAGGAVPPTGNPNVGQDQGKHIFVTGVVGRAMGSGKFTASEIAVLTQAAAQAYEIMNKPPVDQRQMPQEPPPPPDGDPGPGPDDFPGGP